MKLSNPLNESNLDAARWIYNHLDNWRTTDEAIGCMADHLPDFDLESCLLKTVAINSLFSTQVFAILRMGMHVSSDTWKKRLRRRRI